MTDDARVCPPVHASTDPAAANDPVIVALGGDLDLATAPAATNAITEALRTSPHIVLDMRHVPFCDSAGLRVIAAAVRDARALGGSLTLRDPQPLPMTALRISGIISALQIEVEHTDRPPAE